MKASGFALLRISLVLTALAGLGLAEDSSGRIEPRPSLRAGNGPSLEGDLLTLQEGPRGQESPPTFLGEGHARPTLRVSEAEPAPWGHRPDIIRQDPSARTGDAGATAHLAMLHPQSRPSLQYASYWSESPGAPGATNAPLQQGNPQNSRRGPEGLSLRAAMGFTLDPDTFLLASQVDYRFADGLSLSPLVQLGLSDDDVLLAPSFNLKYTFDLSTEQRKIPVKPFMEGGVGFCYLHKEHRRGDDDEVGFLLNFGFGADFYVTDRVALGSNVLFNVLPGEVLGEHFFFTWEFIALRFDLW